MLMSGLIVCAWMWSLFVKSYVGSDRVGLNLERGALMIDVFNGSETDRREFVAAHWVGGGELRTFAIRFDNLAWGDTIEEHAGALGFKPWPFRTVYYKPLSIPGTPIGIFRVYTPLWFPLLAILIPTIIAHLLVGRRPRQGFCKECGYDLTGNRSGRCPECGTQTSAAMGPGTRSPP